MDDISRRRNTLSSRQRRSWCCSFTVPPSSPDSLADPTKPIHNHTRLDVSKPASVPSSPGLSLVGRILSPGRVSPIDSSPIQPGPSPPPPPPPSSAVRSESFRAAPGPAQTRPEAAVASRSESGNVFDVRLNLRGKRGGGLVLELNSEVLSSNSELFAGLISECRRSSGGSSSSASASAGSKMCRIEVPEVENLGVFREAIELMFEVEEDDVTKRLLRIGAYRVIDVLEVSAGIMFTKGVLSCLKYLEAVPWTEEEEEKLRNLFTRFKFDETTTRDILARLYLLDSVDSQQNLSKQLVSSITTCTDLNARHELKLLVKGLLCRSSVYKKDHHDLNKEDIYAVCRSCVSSLVSLFEEANGNISHHKAGKETGKPMIERVSRQVDNINWLLDILLDQQMAEDFVDIWAEQGELLKMHGDTSPMVRYELSRVSAILFVAMGTRKLQCRSESRSGLLQAWFGPMLLDFGWLQRCRKGLDIKSLEEALGQTLLTLPLKQQYTLFMEWFRYFSKHSTDCPNLSKAFQIWWRRSFLRGSETSAIESR
ncbi:BTB/POZ domain-containing protein At2g13690 [Argentina anserina]|uniref:BTB/POZ domain-containing protein At2g13690 n=1 Tax=Argentina anserina TaxID=57926 RepID=UPI002176512F|nr:BTB/POZ domain-containing protein At2g13690 [Potentilla anserina]